MAHCIVWICAIFNCSVLPLLIAALIFSGSRVPLTSHTTAAFLSGEAVEHTSDRNENSSN